VSCPYINSKIITKQITKNNANFPATGLQITY